MAKKVYSLGLDPEERAAIERLIIARKKADKRDQYLDFSKWMREAIAEKLERDEPGKQMPAQPSRASDLSPGKYRVEPLDSGKTDAPGVLVVSGSTDYHAIPGDDEPARAAEEAPLAGHVPSVVTPARKKSVPRVRSTRAAVKKLVEQDTKKKGIRS